MYAPQRALALGSRQLRCHGRALARTALRAYSDASEPAASSSSSSSSSPPSPSSTISSSSPTQAEPAAAPPSAVPRAKKPWATSTTRTAKAASSSSASAPTSAAASAPSTSVLHVPRRAFYQPTTVAHGEDAASSSSADIPAVDWSSSFHGISSRPATETQFNALMRPLDEQDIEVKPDGIIYLPEIRYRRRLNEAFGPMGWGLIPKGEAVVGASIVTREYALIVGGRFVSQAQGENSYFSADQLPSAVEGCKSNALMRCCKDLGIASELWDPSFIRWFKKTHMEEVWVEHTTTKKKRTFWYRKGAVEVAYPYRQTK